MLFRSRCQSPILAFMTPVSGWAFPVYISNHTHSVAEVALTVTDGDTNEVVLQETYTLSPDETRQVASVRGFVSDKRLFVLRYTVNGTAHANHFLTGMPPYAPQDMLRWLDVIRQLPEPFDFTP